MSVWKNAAKAHQKTHRERHQPEERKHLGLLEKKKDYVKRATDYNEKKQTLRALRKKALNKNPDEFYYHMINSKIDQGIHHEKETEEEDTPDQLKIIRTQDLKYISYKRTLELKKINRLQSQLHFTSVNHGVKNKRKIFLKNVEDEDDSLESKREVKEIPDLDMEVLVEAAKTRKSKYKELAKRVQREKELALIQRKFEVKRQIESRSSKIPPKKVRKGCKTKAPVYKWTYERKK